MRRMLSIILAPTFLLCSSLSAKANPRVHRGPTSPRVSKERVIQAKPRTANGISPERTSAIQSALVRAGYLKEASGKWDSDTQAAMEKLQADNGWQVKLVPDARALIKLGLGPGSDPEANGYASVSQ